MHGSAKRGTFVGVAAAAVLIGTGGAGTRGRQLVANSHIGYSKAVGQVPREELLLHGVRRRYLEPLQFVTVTGISTNIGFSAAAQANARLDDSATSTEGRVGVEVNGVGDIRRIDQTNQLRAQGINDVRGPTVWYDPAGHRRVA